MPTKIQLTTLACAAMLAFAGSAEAAPTSKAPAAAETTSVRVSVADLNLRQAAGVAVAHNRIRQAAVLVCGNEPLSSGLTFHRVYGSCRKAAVEAAMADLDTQIASARDPRSSSKATALVANR